MELLYSIIEYCIETVKLNIVIFGILGYGYEYKKIRTVLVLNFAAITVICMMRIIGVNKFPSKNQQKSHGLNFDNRFITLYNNLSHLSTSTF